MATAINIRTEEGRNQRETMRQSAMQVTEVCSETLVSARKPQELPPRGPNCHHSSLSAKHAGWGSSGQSGQLKSMGFMKHGANLLSSILLVSASDHVTIRLPYVVVPKSGVGNPGTWNEGPATTSRLETCRILTRDLRQSAMSVRPAGRPLAPERHTRRAVTMWS